jgi:hypothetical protein
MTTTDKKDFMALAGRSPRCASVLADPSRTKFALLDLGKDAETATAEASDLGMTVHCGVVAVSKYGNLDFVCLPGYELIVLRALTEFGRNLCAEAEAREIHTLESWARLPDERTVN